MIKVKVLREFIYRSVWNLSVSSDLKRSYFGCDVAYLRRTMHLAIKQIPIHLFWNAKWGRKTEWLNNSSWHLKKKEWRYTVFPSCLQSRTFLLYRQRTRELNCAEKRPTNSFIFNLRSDSFPILRNASIRLYLLLYPSPPIPPLHQSSLTYPCEFRRF